MNIPNPEHAKLAQDLVNVCYESFKLEKESSAVETSLNEKEADLKINLKKSSKPSNDAVAMRKDVEKLRQELSNAHAQIGMLIIAKT